MGQASASASSSSANQTSGGNIIHESQTWMAWGVVGLLVLVVAVIALRKKGKR